ncbi:MAG: hypothetical protein IPO32_03255 [Crocinitomicaceae bacterium]|nr:hypothetical protein [Crocinitomicaceae bacterium]
MKSFTYYVNDDLRYDYALLLSVLDPVCSLISLYDGPSLNNVELKTDDTNSKTARGLKNEYTFTFHFDDITKTSVFNYFFKGESQLKLTLHRTGETLIHLPENTSLTIELELRKALLKYSFSESEIIASVRSHSAKNEIEEEPFEIILPLQSGYTDNAKFIQNMYEICTEFSPGLCPLFSYAQMKEERREMTHERFYRVNTSNDHASVEFEDYLGDSGSHSYPNPYNYEFFYREKGKILIRVYRSGNTFVFQTRFEDHARFEMRVRQYFEGKL